MLEFSAILPMSATWQKSILVYAYEIILALITAVEVYKGIKISRPE